MEVQEAAHLPEALLAGAVTDEVAVDCLAILTNVLVHVLKEYEQDVTFVVVVREILKIVGVDPVRFLGKAASDCVRIVAFRLTVAFELVGETSQISAELICQLLAARICNLRDERTEVR